MFYLSQGFIENILLKYFLKLLSQLASKITLANKLKYYLKGLAKSMTREYFWNLSKSGFTKTLAR